MNKTLLTLSAVALSSGTAVAHNTDAEVNKNYIKLASISPIVEFDHNMVVSQNFDLSIPLDPDDPTDPDHPINESCVARGYDIVGGCDATGDCIPDPCPENPLYMACTCFCAVNSCTENGYVEQICTKYDTETDCPMLPNQGFVKCDEMDGPGKCTVDGYIDTNPNCTGYTKLEYCSYDSNYKKCVPMTDAEKCDKDGYYFSSCPSGQSLTTKCPHGNENLYKSCELNDCASSYVTSCSSGYVLNTSDSCTDTFGTKYKCIADSCSGYDQTSPCGSGYTETICQAGSTTKYKCVADTCSGYDQTSACSPADGYTQSTCLAGSTTKYKCIANTCTGYNLTSCLPVKGYSSIETCQSGSTTKYKCTMNDCEAYFYTGSCPDGYEFIDVCFEGPAKKYKCKKPDTTTSCSSQGYPYTSVSNPYEIDGVCPTDSNYFSRKCKSATPTACKAAGYTRAAGSCNQAYYNEALCPCDTMWAKCVCDEGKAAADGVACPK